MSSTPTFGPAGRTGVAAGVLVALLVLVVMPAAAHGGEFDVIIETAPDVAGQAYGIGLTWTDGDPVTDADVTIEGSQGDAIASASAEETSPGVYIALLDATSAGEWEIEVIVSHPDSEASIGFTQALAPGTAGPPVVLVDTAEPDRVGSTPVPGDGILPSPEEPPSSTSTTTPATTSTVAEAPSTTAPDDTHDEDDMGHGSSATGVTIEVDARGGPAWDIGMRLAHLAAIGLWAGPIVAGLFGTRNRTLVALAVVGVGTTVGTGVVLALWGSPISYPGVFDWDGLLAIPYGSEYGWSFIVKMGGVLVAALATLRWAIWVDRWAAWTTVAGMAVAVAAVTAVTQFHLLTHM